MVKWVGQRTYVATLTSSKDYAVARNSKVYHTTLAEYIFEVLIPLYSAWTLKLFVDSTDINPGIQWPDVHYMTT